MSTAASTQVRGRLAPSPTGALHLGNARSFLIAWLHARQQGGQVVMRMEDLDHPKVKPDTAQGALDDLHWLGLDWDEGPDIGGPHTPYVQTSRRPLYRQALQHLHAQGLVYPCICSRRDVEAGQSAPQSGEDGLFYDGTCRGRFASYADACAALPPGRLPAWRFQVPSWVVTTFDDGFHGPQSQQVGETVGDFVIARDHDGAGYMLAVVVDDAAMGITEVLRGDDLLAATHRQLLLYRALGLVPPRFIHVPLVVSPEGRRLAKRHGDTRIATIRAAGVAPETVVGVLAWWCGWAAWGEALRPTDLLARANLSTLTREPAVLTDAVTKRLQI